MFAIELKNITKKFIVRYDKAMVFRSEIEALKEVTLNVERGQVFGLIGRNGSGKTTLLNIIAGIMSPTSGEVKVNGKVSCLLTLGAGFQQELSGRENIFLNGALLGMTEKEMRKKFYDIVKFSELDGFLEKPLQSYSQGMRARLGFGIAAHVDFDILLIDEILSVGDVSFQSKSYEKIEEFRKQGKTMIIVSQGMELIERICDNVALLERGEVVGIDKPEAMIKQYHHLLATRCFSEVYADLNKLMVEREIRWWGKKEDWGKRLGTREVEIGEVKIFNSHLSENSNFKTGDDLTVSVDFIVHREIREPHFGVAIFREDGVYCYGPNSRFDGYRIKQLKRGKGNFKVKFKNISLLPGDYRFSIAIWDKKEIFPFDYYCGFYKFKITGQKSNVALINLELFWDKSTLRSFGKTATGFLKRIFLSGQRKISTIYFNSDKSLAISLPPFDFMEKWGKNFGSGDILVKNVDFLDKDALLRSFFDNGEMMKVYVELERKNPLFTNNSQMIWFGIFREDKIYCHGVSRELSEKEDEVILVYPHLHLLSGRYYLSVAVWQQGAGILDCHHGLFPFEIYSPKQDHGTVYIKHQWRWQFNG